MIYTAPSRGGYGRFYGYGQEGAPTPTVPPQARTAQDQRSYHLAVLGTTVGFLSFVAFVAVQMASRS